MKRSIRIATGAAVAAAGITAAAVGTAAAQTTATEGPSYVSASPAASSSCHTGELKFTWGGAPNMNDTNQQKVTVHLTNTGDRTCTLHGFPDVRLVSDTGKVWLLGGTGEKPGTFTLRPGQGGAAVPLTIAPVDKNSTGPGETPFVPSKVQITLPGETDHATLAWPYGGALLDQSTATVPATFAGPIVAD